VPLELATRDTPQGVTILSLQGQLILGQETADLHDAIKQLLTQGKKKILLNLENVSFMDSAGVGTLVAAFGSARAAGGQMKLTRLGEKLRKSLVSTRLLGVFEIYDDEAEALQHFQ